MEPLEKLKEDFFNLYFYETSKDKLWNWIEAQIKASQLEPLVMPNEMVGGRNTIAKITLPQAYDLTESIIGKLNRRGFIKDEHVNDGLLKQIIIQHFVELQ